MRGISVTVYTYKNYLIRPNNGVLNNLLNYHLASILLTSLFKVLLTQRILSLLYPLPYLTPLFPLAFW